MKKQILIILLFISSLSFSQSLLWKPVSTRTDQINRAVKNTKSFMGKDTSTVWADINYIVNIDTLIHDVATIKNNTAVFDSTKTRYKLLVNVLNFPDSTKYRKLINIGNFPTGFNVNNQISGYALAIKQDTLLNWLKFAGRSNSSPFYNSIINFPDSTKYRKLINIGNFPDSTKYRKLLQTNVLNFPTGWAVSSKQDTEKVYLNYLKNSLSTQLIYSHPATLTYDKDSLQATTSIDSLTFTGTWWTLSMTAYSGTLKVSTSKSFTNCRTSYPYTAIKYENMSVAVFPKVYWKSTGGSIMCSRAGSGN